MFRPELDFLDAINAPVFVLDATDETNPTYVAFNAYACAGAGLNARDLIGKNAREVYPGRLGELAFRRHRQAVRSAQKSSYALTLNLNGKEHEIQTTLTPIFDADGALSQLVGTSLNVSKNRVGHSAQQGIEMLSSEMEQFISLAAHDLRSPMLNVRQLTDMILEDFQDLGDGKSEMIRMLERVASTSLNMIRDLLTAANATDVSENVTEFLLCDLCSEILVSLDPSGKHQVSCAPMKIEADRTAFQIVLRNLIDNAFKHSGKSMVKLSISFARDTPGLIEGVLKDNGIGFPDPTIAFLDSGELKPESGFGLLGVRRLVEARGGSISAQHPPGGQGCVIRFTLPGRPLDERADAVARPHCGPAETSAAN